MTIDLLDSTSVVDTSKACVRKTIAAPATDVLGRIANLETRLARSAAEIDAAQAVRYRVFVEEMKAQVTPDAERRKRDVDGWDAICDHLLVLDTAIEGDPEEQIVGT
jgi:putative hemolysin